MYVCPKKHGLAIGGRRLFRLSNGKTYCRYYCAHHPTPPTIRPVFISLSGRRRRRLGRVSSSSSSSLSASEGSEFVWVSTPAAKVFNSCATCRVNLAGDWCGGGRERAVEWWCTGRSEIESGHVETGGMGWTGIRVCL